MNGCQTCGGYGMHHDPVAHGQVTENDEPCVCKACDGFGWNYDRLGARVTCPDCSGANVRRESPTPDGHATCPRCYPKARTA